MAFTIQQVENEPIIIIKVTNPFDPETEVAEQNEAIAKLAASFSGMVYVIADLSRLEIKFSDLVLSLAEVRSSEASVLHNQKLVTLTVGSSEMVQLAVEAAKQQQYGAVDIRLFSSVDEALEHARNALNH